jgi:hypothetical protein
MTYQILEMTGHPIVFISIKDKDYPDYIHLGYQIIFSGTKKECFNYFDEHMMEED